MNIDYYDMLTYRRKEGSKGQKVFNRKYLQPVFGKPDAHGNYTLIVGKKPRVAFMAHHDTVHKKLNKADIYVDNGAVYSDGADVLGADCTTGIYLILRMIEAGVPGVYVVHAGEEIGCIGSSALVEDHPDWIDHVDFAISFDRKGYSEVITHQRGIRTCSDEFAESLAGILDLNMEPSDQGVYTDSNEYRGVIAECTNISVGYFHQHTIKEYQDLDFLDLLEDALINADWSKLVKSRAPAMEIAGLTLTIGHTPITTRVAQTRKRNSLMSSINTRNKSQLSFAPSDTPLMDFEMTALPSRNLTVLTSEDSQYYKVNGKVVRVWFEWPPVTFPCGPFFRACYDGEEESGWYGTGPTPERAIEDLIEMYNC